MLSPVGHGRRRLRDLALRVATQRRERGQRGFTGAVRQAAPQELGDLGPAGGGRRQALLVAQHHARRTTGGRGGRGGGERSEDDSVGEHGA